MAHVTRSFLRRSLVPGVIAALGVPAVATAGVVSATRGSVFAWSVATVLALSASWLTLVELMCLVYRRSYLAPGTYEYEFGVKPHSWHRKMGALWTLHRLVPQRKRLWLYRRLGARTGRVVLAGIISDPELARLGDSVVLGGGSRVLTHVIENVGHGLTITLGIVAIGDRAVVGANAVVMPGAHIGKDVTVPAGSVISKYSRFGMGNE